MIAFLHSRARLVLVASFAVAASFLIAEPGDYFSDVLPYALGALFVVFDLFMHGEHSGDSGSREPTEGGER